MLKRLGTSDRNVCLYRYETFQWENSDPSTFSSWDLTEWIHLLTKYWAKLHLWYKFRQFLTVWISKLSQRGEWCPKISKLSISQQHYSDAPLQPTVTYFASPTRWALSKGHQSKIDRLERVCPVGWPVSWEPVSLGWPVSFVWGRLFNWGDMDLFFPVVLGWILPQTTSSLRRNISVAYPGKVSCASLNIWTRAKFPTGLH